MSCFAILICLLLADVDRLTPGDHTRSVQSGDLKRTYLVHVPASCDHRRPAAVVLILHGAMMNAGMMSQFSGLNAKADQAGFIAVYPNGTGVGGLFLTWNSGGIGDRFAKSRPDDAAYIGRVLDDLAGVANVDPKRVFATGMSNGGMMCYRLATEMPERIAAIAPVAGTLAVGKFAPARPVSVMHFHGTRDTLVPYEGPRKRSRGFITIKGVDESIRACVECNRCAAEPVATDEPDSADDGTTVSRKTFGGGTDGSEVVLFTIREGGHTWPGRPSPLASLGKATRDISANDLIWEFFEKHPMK